MTPRHNPALTLTLVLLLVLAALWGTLRLIVPATHRGPHARPQAPTPVTPRIVALSPAIAVILRDLGAADRVVGRHGWDFVLDPSVPVCGDQAGIEYETLLGAEPTHVLIELAQTPPRLVEMAAQHHWELQNFRLLTLEDVQAATDRLANQFAGAGRAADIRRRMADLWARPRPPRRLGGVLLLDTVSPPGALGPGSAHDQILRRIGGTPAIERGKPYMTLDAEEVLRLAPEGIIIFTPRDYGTSPRPVPSDGELRARLGRIGELAIPAVRSGRIAVIDDPLGAVPSTALLDVTEQMEAILKQWASPP